MELKNKLLISFILFIFILSIFSFSFAVEIPNIEVTYNNQVYTLSDFPLWSDDYEYLAVFGSDTNPSTFYIYGYTTNKLVGNGTFQARYSSFGVTYSSDWYDHGIGTFSKMDSTDEPPIWSNFDILDDDGSVVFPQAPQPIQVVEPMEMKQVEEILPEIWKIAMMILPGCLLIFGMLLVVYLIKSKNLLQL